MGCPISVQATPSRKHLCKPATDKQGNAVAVLVPIEVTFRLY